MAAPSKPPRTSETHTLPFEKLSPDAFEELCLWLVERLDFERVEHLGKAGSDRGRDIAAWKDGRSFAFQCKRVGAFNAAKAKKEIEKIRRELAPAEQPEELVFLVSRAVSDGVRKEIRRAWGEAATCHFWGSTELNEKVSRFPEIVDHFFHQRLAAVHSPLHHLPPPPADFVGRKTDLAALRRAIKKGGATICGLQGQGGVGKTALALVLASKVAADYPDAQIFLDLRGVSEKPLSTAEAMAHIVRSFYPEAQLPEGVQLAAAYRDALTGKRVLLLMDNASGPDQVEPLVPPVGCALLVTSRQRFALPGLTVRDLDLLPEEDACALLLGIAERIGVHAKSIARLCGYLPFALRIAAGSLVERPDISPEALEKRLGREKEKAAIGERVLGIGLSLLTDAFQQRFRHLAVFAGDFDASAAAAVWGLDEEEADETLGALVRGSLLEGKDGRYKLHDLARAFAGSRLTVVDKAQVELRHAEHYRDVLARADDLYLEGNENIFAGLALFDRERHQIIAGQAWAAANLQTNEEAERLASGYPNAGIYILLLRLSPREHIGWLEAGREGARRTKDRAMEGNHLGNLGLAYANLGETRRAIEYHEQDLAIAREIGDRHGEGNALGNLGLAYADLGETRRAIEYHYQYLAIAREIGDRRGEGIALGNLGIAYKNLGETRRAIETYEQRLTIAREIGDRRGEGIASWNLGLVYESLGELDRAVEWMQVLVDFERELGHSDAEKHAAGVEAIRARLAFAPQPSPPTPLPEGEGRTA